jgi:hypothetical protein
MQPIFWLPGFSENYAQRDLPPILRDYSTKMILIFRILGTTPVTSKLITPALIDAKTGSLTDMRDMP